jgi:hypothetical protein
VTADLYSVRYPSGSSFTIRGELHVATFPADAGDGLAGTVNVVVDRLAPPLPPWIKDAGAMVVLDPRALITRRGQKVYGPRSVPLDAHTGETAAWLISNSLWDRPRP